jgi:DNA-binding beta-propeller fold protein YncE
MKNIGAMLLGLSLLGSLLSAPAAGQSLPRADYKFTTDLKLGGVGLGDYLTLDSSSHRLYVTHYDQVSVVDTVTNAILGAVRPFKMVHGVAIVGELGKGYASDGGAGVLKEFDLSDLHIIKEIKVTDDADGVVFDPSSGSVLVVGGDAKTLSIVDAKDDTVRTVVLPGRPEFLTVNQRGKVFVNLVDVGAVAEVDIATGHVVATWPLKNCKSPHGIAYDARTDRLFSSCANGRMVVVDPSTGHNLANLEIGQGSDTVVADSDRGFVFSSNSDGTLTVVHEGVGDVYRVIRTIPTFFGGRNMAVEPRAGTLFIAHGNMKMVSTLVDLRALRFGWDGLDVARFEVAP